MALNGVLLQMVPERDLFGRLQWCPEPSEIYEKNSLAVPQSLSESLVLNCHELRSVLFWLSKTNSNAFLLQYGQKLNIIKNGLVSESILLGFAREFESHRLTDSLCSTFSSIDVIYH